MAEQERICQDLVCIATEVKDGKYGLGDDIDSVALEEELQEVIDSLPSARPATHIADFGDY